MVKLFGAAALALLAFPAFAAYCPVTTNANSILRQAPGPAFAQIGTVASGTTVPVEVCFDRGAFCAVTTAAGKGFISGDLLSLPSGQTLKNLEADRWAKIDADEPAGPAAFDRCNIVVWGDSLSNGTFGPDLSRLLGRAVSMQGVAGEDGQSIATRMLADNRYDNRIVVIWDRQWTGEEPGIYMEQFAPMVAKAARLATAYIVVSTIPDLDGSEKITAEKDAADTAAVNAALRAKYEGNFLDVTGLLADPATRTDGLHLTPAGNAAVAGAIADYILQRGW